MATPDAKSDALKSTSNYLSFLLAVLFCPYNYFKIADSPTTKPSYNFMDVPLFQYSESVISFELILE